MTYSDLCYLWIQAKDAEKAAIEKRRSVEDQIVKILAIPETFEGTYNSDAPDGFKVKIVSRMSRKVNSELLQELADSNGLTAHLSHLFRWKADISTSAWEKADESITRPLMAAIITTPSRASFTISKEQ
jgi:hypothetical protein